MAFRANSFRFLWRTVNSKPPIIPFGIVACTFPTTFLEIALYIFCKRVTTPNTIWPRSAKDCYTCGLPSNRPFPLQCLPCVYKTDCHRENHQQNTGNGKHKKKRKWSGNLIIIIFIPFRFLCISNAILACVMSQGETCPADSWNWHLKSLFQVILVRFMTSAFWFLSLLSRRVAFFVTSN